MAVSYTHLDVYKRQDFTHTDPGPAVAKFERAVAAVIHVIARVAGRVEAGG